MNLKMGVRPSALSLKQAEEIKQNFPFINFEVIAYETKGDRDKYTLFTEIEGSDFFTREIEEALIRKEIDAALHSAKDVEDNMPEELTIAATTASISKSECLVSTGNKKLDQLVKGAIIGTSSAKRKEALLRYRPDFNLRDIRGTIEERLEQLDHGKFDAIIVAEAALIRLGLQGRITEVISPAIMPAHPLQGALAIQVRRDRADLIEIFTKLEGKINYEN